MTTDSPIPVTHLCVHYQADEDFFNALQEYGLLEVVWVEKTPCVPVERIREVERMVHLHYDLNINMEGLDAISHLLTRVEHLNQELQQTKSRLRYYEIL